MTAEFFYVIDAEGELLSNIDPSLRSINKALIVSVPFVTGSEASIYLTHIADKITEITHGEQVKTENPIFFPTTEHEDFSDEWSDGAAARVLIYGTDDSVLLNGRLMIKADAIPESFKRTLQ